VDKYLPEFQKQMLGVPQEKGGLLLKKPKHPITVRNVLSHTSGMPFKTAIEEPTLDIYTLRERAVSYALTPLLHEPDSKYLYSNAGINTAGAIIEVVSGMSFEDFMEKRVLKPLGMKDTTFWPNESQLKRLAKAYKANAAKTDLEETPITQLKYPLTDHSRTPMPAGGYFSTAEDVARFCQMLLNGGTYKGKRVLSEKAVQAMTTVQSGEAQNNNRIANYGLGLNITVQSQGKPDELSVGSFAHGGAYKTGMWVDPKRGLVMVLMVHHSTFAGNDGNKINPTFLKAALQQYGK
jgi:CubicO group peptidase (beta-lactamase class C family)